MIYQEFQGKQLSLLGFGAMRLPTLENGKIDEALVKEMTRYAIDNGVNYFDTAYPYHEGESEIVMGRILSEYPRDSYYLADKYPGHQILSTGYNPAEIFEEQLVKCGVDYFDFYLLHNVNEKSMETYLDPQWDILGYFKKQKELGRIKHLGFSAHAQTKGLEEFLNACGNDMEFCQLQINYLDWTLQNGKDKYDLLKKWNIPVWVMEPVRGGKLAKLDASYETKMKALRPDESIAAWSFRFLQELSDIKMILSGMSNMEQMMDNIKTFENYKPLSDDEHLLLNEIAKSMSGDVPCTACRYCCDGCPKGLDIPMLLNTYNNICVSPAITVTMLIENLPEDKKPSNCINCGKCSRTCPQNIDIPTVLKSLDEKVASLPTWAEVCRKREEAAKQKS